MLSTTRFTHLAPALLITRNSQTLDTILFSVLLDNLVTGRYLVALVLVEWAIIPLLHLIKL
jgi:hypothetical protein